MAPRKVSKGKKPAETMRQRQQRLLREQRARKAVKTKPTSSTPRGAQGPRTPPVQGPYQKPVSAMQGNTGRTGATDSRGRRLNQPAKPGPKNPPPTQKYKPRVSNVGPQIKQADRVRSIQSDRTHRQQVQSGKTPAHETPGQKIRRTGGTYRGMKYPGGGKPGVRIGASARARTAGTRGGTSRGGNRSSQLKGTLAAGLVTAAAVGSLRNPVTKAKQKASRKEGQKATLKGKPVVWKSGKWAAAPSQSAGKYNTKDADGTVRSRQKVGAKKVGAKKVGTYEQSFDKAYGTAKKAGKTTFTFDGKKYSTK